MKVLGGDEAGRGPIIGPLVICGAMIDEAEQGWLTEIGAKDSKLLSPRQREALFKLLSAKLKHKLVVLQPADIDAAVRGEGGMNLNWLEADVSAQIIKELKPDRAILDCPSPNTKAYSSFIHEKLGGQKVELVCVHHADRDFPIVGAASILAKVTRDRLVEELKKKLGVDFGSGYIADPRTKAFLEKNWDRYPDIFRHSWAPYKKAAGLDGQQTLQPQ
jgi:ribonuclease HII